MGNDYNYDNNGYDNSGYDSVGDYDNSGWDNSGWDNSQTNYNQDTYAQQTAYIDPNAQQNAYAQQNSYAQQNNYAQQNAYTQQNAYAQQNTSYQQNAYGYNNGYDNANYNGYDANGYNYGQPVPMVSFGGLSPAIEAIKSCGKSVLFLIVTICYSLTFLLTMISSFRSGVGSGIGGLFLNIPMILMVIGMWVIFVNAKKPEPQLKGLGACRAAIIIWNIGAWCLLVLTVIVGAILIGVSGMIAEEMSYMLDVDGTGAVVGVIAAVVIVLLIYVILYLLYYMKMLKTTRVVKDIVTYGTSKKKVSMYLIVINFLAILGSIGSIFSGAALAAVMGYIPELLYSLGAAGSDVEMALEAIYSMMPPAWMNVVSPILGVVTLICINIVLIQLRGKLKKIFGN